MHARSTLVLFLLVTPVAVMAQEASAPVRGDIQLAIDLGHTRFASALVRPDGSRFGLFFARHLTPRAAWTFDITCTGGVPAGLTEEDAFTICTGSLGARLDIAPTRRGRPYLRAAYGQAQLDAMAEADVFDIDDRGGATTVAAGVRRPLGRGGRAGWHLELAFTRHDLLGGPAAHRSVALGATWRLR